MRSSLIVVVSVAAIAAASLAWTQPWAAHASPMARHAAKSGFLLLPPAAPAGQMVMYGHVKKLRLKGGHYELGFDPAWFTSGITASRAKLQDTGSSEVPNDNYIVEAGHRLLTYLVSSSAKITVLVNEGTKGISATPISVAELSRIVNGGKHRKLYEPLDSGIWIRVRIDTVRELDQQYRP